MILAVLADERRNFGNGDIGRSFRLDLIVVDDDLGMEDLLLDTLVEVVGHRADEHALREVGDFRDRDQRFQLRIGRGGDVLVRYRV